jgi:transposase
VGERAKTDSRDAALLQRYLMAEAARLRPYRVPPKAVVALKELLRARARLTVTKGSIDQALGDIGSLSRTRTALTARLNAAIRLIDKKLARCLARSGYAADARRCQCVPGIGPLSGAALIATYYRGQFASADAFIAYLGLDLRVRESGRYRGQRKLSKRGDPELRRLLFNAARAGARTQHWRAYYERLRARGLSSTAATVALSRKLARIAFALLKNQTEFRQLTIA